MGTSDLIMSTGKDLCAGPGRPPGVDQVVTGQELGTHSAHHTPHLGTFIHTRLFGQAPQLLPVPMPPEIRQ